MSIVYGEVEIESTSSDSDSNEKKSLNIKNQSDEIRIPKIVKRKKKINKPYFYLYMFMIAINLIIIGVIIDIFIRKNNITSDNKDIDNNINILSNQILNITNINVNISKEITETLNFYEERCQDLPINGHHTITFNKKCHEAVGIQKDRIFEENKIRIFKLRDDISDLESEKVYNHEYNIVLVFLFLILGAIIILSCTIYQKVWIYS